jgi:hypothetical protein
MKTKEEFHTELHKRRHERVPGSMDVTSYLLACVDLMFEMTAETLADLHKPDQK